MPSLRTRIQSSLLWTEKGEQREREREKERARGYITSYSPSLAHSLLSLSVNLSLSLSLSFSLSIYIILFSLYNLGVESHPPSGLGPPSSPCVLSLCVTSVGYGGGGEPRGWTIPNLSPLLYLSSCPLCPPHIGHACKLVAIVNVEPLDCWNIQGCQPSCVLVLSPLPLLPPPHNSCEDQEQVVVLNLVLEIGIFGVLRFLYCTYLVGLTTT